MEYMYFITALEKNGSTVDEHNWPALGTSYVYEYAVIEDIPEGKVVGRNDRRRWFQWDYVKKGFFAIKKPNPYDVTENFALK